MNKQAILFHLKEAAEQLASTISEVGDEDFGDESFQVDMSHLYHHLNTAWNARDCTMDEFNRCSEEDFARWHKFPSEEEMLLF